MHPWLKKWGPFLFGTPKRTIATLGVLLVVLLACKPSLGEIFVSNLIQALSPLFQAALWVLVIGVGLKILFKGFSGSGTKKK